MENIKAEIEAIIEKSNVVGRYEIWIIGADEKSGSIVINDKKRGHKVFYSFYVKFIGVNGWVLFRTDKDLKNVSSGVFHSIREVKEAILQLIEVVIPEYDKKHNTLNVIIGGV